MLYCMTRTGPELLTIEIKEAALRAGFDRAGVAAAVAAPTYPHLVDWITAGFAGGMDYIPRRQRAYEHPRHLLDGCRSVVMLAANYRTGEPPRVAPGQGRVSRYCWGSADYHDVLRRRLDVLATEVERLVPGARTRGVVDTAPLLERDFARLAGLGWFGKNTMLLGKSIGSWFFLAALLVDLELAADPPHTSSHCGTCTACLDACPTDAFPSPGVLDARRCISYLTIELRGRIPRELRPGVGDWLFGCDVCQEVCPWNRKAPTTDEPAFQPRADLTPVDAIELLSLDEAGFRERFRKTPMWRAKRPGLLRNAAIVLGNAGDSRAVPALIGALNDPEPVIRGAAAWSLGELGTEAARSALQSRFEIETDADVRDEIEWARRAFSGMPS
jgi:epoxyqueuosine reductase